MSISCSSSEIEKRYGFIYVDVDDAKTKAAVSWTEGEGAEAVTTEYYFNIILDVTKAAEKA